MKKKWLLIPAILILLNVTVFVLKGYSSDRTQNVQGTTIVTINNNGFTPNTISVNKDDEVNLMIHNIDNKKHNFVLRDLFIFTHNLNPGETTTVKFKAYKQGTFTFVSDTPGTPEQGYKGTFIVK
ncbi:MAG TPA: hypothetical protein DDY49_10510 [Paenibacillaceae bacterium]|nr:hypothetical protein [Paenibacillaceae bacterium]